MKRVASILLLALLLFNWIGYRFMSDILAHQSDLALEQKLDNQQYKEEDLVEMRVPLSLPYQTDWKSFERVDGEIEIQGVLYKYVKRKIEKGQLVLLCVPNEEKMKLQTAKDDFFKLVNDLQHSKGKKAESTTNAKNTISDYQSEENDWSLAYSATPVTEANSKHRFNLSNTPGDAPDQPPRAI